MFSICSTGLHGEEFPILKGWKTNGDIIIYRPANLWKYIDGAADQFLNYDFQILKLREFRKNDVIVTVDIYDMGSPINAFGIYSTERPDDAKLLNIGTEAVVIPPYSALMLKERFYVKVMIQQGELTEKDGEEILKDVAASLPGTTDLPSELKMLPQKDMVHGTLKYITAGYMGLSEVSNVVSADYRAPDGKVYRAFVMVIPKKEQVDETWKMLAEKWQKETLKDQTVLYREIPYEGFIGVIMADGMITGVSGVEEMVDLLAILMKK
ncbi:MAG: hypothetical protein JW927_15170 [Deltaproteobacteria bacterium]|nr:hypothetical protein [Deltaproteobacteria bacterium]